MKRDVESNSQKNCRKKTVFTKEHSLQKVRRERLPIWQEVKISNPRIWRKRCRLRGRPKIMM